MAIINKSKKEILCSDFELYTSLFQKARGLMFSGRKNIVFEFPEEKHVPLHTFFVFFPINVIFLDKSKRVVEVARINPFAAYMPKNQAGYIIELCDHIKGTEEGDLLEF